jgi:polyisoprenoid-binding protein YceI
MGPHDQRTSRRSILGACAVSLAMTGCGRLVPSGNQTTDTAALPPGSYRLDPDHAAVLFKVDHLGFSTYVGRFNRISGRLTFDPALPTDSQLDVTVDIASIDTPDDELDKTLRGPGWFDAERFPTARFVSRSITRQDAANGTVHGDLTLHGVTAPLDLAVHFRGGADNWLTGSYTLGFEAETQFQRTAFGIASLVPAIGDTVRLEIHAEFQRIDG